MSLPCPDCGGHRWAAAGYCMEIACAGYYTDPDYPRNAPEELKWNRAPQTKALSKKNPPKPPKKGRRAREIQYEAMGQTAPWLEKPMNGN